MSALKEIRDYLDLTQEEFAEKVGRHQTAISQAEAAGQCGPKLALKILELWTPEMMSLRLTLEDLIRKDGGS